MANQATITIRWNEGERTINIPATESDVYKEVGKVLPDLPIPNVITLDANLYGEAKFRVGKRGTFVKNGVRCPSMYVTEVYNRIHGLETSIYKPAYLTCINPESNNYKFYWLKPSVTGIGATYGRIGAKQGEPFGEKDLQTPYPTYMYWIRYYEKLSKGYVDQSSIYLESTKKKMAATRTVVTKNAPQTPSERLFEQLLKYSRHVVEQSLVDTTVTAAQVKESRRIIRELRNRKTVKGFNSQLQKLIAVSPRKVRFVRELMAVTPKDFPGIINREESLVDAMETVLTGAVSTINSRDSFKQIGVEVYEATDKQKAQVMSHLGTQLAPMVKHIYRVIPKKQQDAFNRYLKANHIHKVKQLWHGSRHENWFSIIQNGLKLNPDAVITGKMFGDGIYFASSSAKSWGYTSYHNTRWANGTQDNGIMGLYATAYGHPFDTYTAGRYTQAQLRAAGKDCVHAHAGQQLYNDEVIFYDEDAVVLNYIVEFAD